MDSVCTLASKRPVDSRRLAGLGCGHSRLALPADSELANRFGLGSWARDQHDYLRLAGSESRIAGNAVGLGTAAAVRPGPQPWCRRLEAGRSFRSLSRSESTPGRAFGYDSGCGSHGARSGLVERTAKTNAPEHRAFTGSIVQPAHAGSRGIARQSAVHKNSVRRGHGSGRLILWSRPSAGEGMTQDLEFAVGNLRFCSLGFLVCPLFI